MLTPSGLAIFPLTFFEKPFEVRDLILQRTYPALVDRIRSVTFVEEIGPRQNTQIVILQGIVDVVLEFLLVCLQGIT